MARRASRVVTQRRGWRARILIDLALCRQMGWFTMMPRHDVAGDEPDRRSNAADAAQVSTKDLDFVHAVLGATRNYYELWAAWPSALQIAEQLGLIAKPGGM